MKITEYKSPREPKQPRSATSEKAAPQGNGLDAAPQGRCFELIPFDKITFDTTPAYLVKA